MYVEKLKQLRKLVHFNMKKINSFLILLCYTYLNGVQLSYLKIFALNA